jgi:CBS domain containing-hemolysin-like protein
VTIEDVLEEIVGEIRDEHDVEGDRYRVVGENRWEIDGRMTLSDLEYELEIELPEGQDFETVSGLVSAITGRVPEVGESMEYEGYRLTVLDGDERHVKRVSLERLEERKDATPLDSESSER